LGPSWKGPPNPSPILADIRLGCVRFERDLSRVYAMSVVR
jgi:hypothetical protein